MVRLHADVSGAVRIDQRTNGARVVSNAVSPATLKHERNDPGPAMGKVAPHIEYRRWRQIVRNRIAFRHDDKRGPTSATLPHAIY